MNGKRIEELENYNINNAAEGDFLPVTDSNNELKKIPVSDLRDQMAKFNLFNIVAMVISLIKSLMEGRTGEVFHVATAFDNAAKYIKTNWFDLSTGTPNMTNFQTLKTICAAAIRQVSNDAFALVKKIWTVGGNRLGYWYLCRNSKTIYGFHLLEGTQPDTIYVVRYRENDSDYSQAFVSLESAQYAAAQHPGSTMEMADWAGDSADKQPYIFDWTKDRVADMLEAMDINEFSSALNPLSPYIRDIEKLSGAVQDLAGANLESRVAALEQALAQAQGGGNNGGGNENENQGEPESGSGPTEEELMTRALALHNQWVNSDTTGWTLEQVIADLEQKAGITPEAGATLAERLEALEALAAQQQ